MDLNNNLPQPDIILDWASLPTCCLVIIWLASKKNGYICVLWKYLFVLRFILTSAELFQYATLINLEYGIHISYITLKLQRVLLMVKLLYSLEKDWENYCLSSVPWWIILFLEFCPRQNKYLVLCLLWVPSVLVFTLIRAQLNHLDKSCFLWHGWSHPLQWLQPPAVHRWILVFPFPELWVLM